MVFLKISFGRAIGRLFALIPIICVLILDATCLPNLNCRIHHYCRILLWLIGIDIVRLDSLRPSHCSFKNETMNPKAEVDPYLYVCNHVSYVDILICLTLVRGAFVARHDMAHWPILGPLASACGAIFVARSCVRQRLKTLFQIKRLLEAEQSVLIFPEGTTRDQYFPKAEDWHAAAFWARRKAKQNVCAIGIHYENHNAVKWVDDDDLIPSLWQLLLQPRSIAWVNMQVVAANESSIRTDAEAVLGVVCSLIKSCQQQTISQQYSHSKEATHA